MDVSYHGIIQTVNDALLVLEACRLGVLNKVDRRLCEKERQLVRSGAVFVWDEEQTAMRRWTDGRSWTASRVHGNFLLYRELDGKRRPSTVTTSKANGLGCPSLASSPDMENSASSSSSAESPTEKVLAAVPSNTTHSTSISPSSLPALAGAAFKNMANLKKDGLIKLSFSVTVVTGNRFHLVHYYSLADITSGLLNVPSKDPVFAGITISREYYPETVNELRGTGELKLHHRGNASPNPRQKGLSKMMDRSQTPWSTGIAAACITKPQKQQVAQPKNHSPLYAPSQIHASKSLHLGTPSVPAMDVKLGSWPYQQNSYNTFGLSPGSDFSHPYSLHVLNTNTSGMNTGNFRSGSIYSRSPTASWNNSDTSALVSSSPSPPPPPYFSPFPVQPAPYQEVAWEKFPSSEVKRQLEAVCAMLSL